MQNPRGSSSDSITARIRDGDPSAFEEFHAQTFTMVWRFAYTYTHAADIADEVVQEAFIRVWQQRDHLDPHGNLLAYLYRLVRNSAIDRRRHARVVQQLEQSHSEENSAPGMGEPLLQPDEEAELMEMRRILFDRIASLPEQRKAALLLRWQHGMSYEDISQALGVTPGAARQLVTRARETLRKDLERHGPAN